MNLSLSTPEGDAVEVTPVEMPDDVKANADAFHRAQANDPVAGEKMLPPKRKPRPAKPEGEAPRRGRPPKSEAPRTTTKAPVKKEPLTPKDYRPGLTMVTDAAWFAGSAMPFIGPHTSPYAAILKLNQAPLVESLNLAANNNATVRKYVEMVSGDGSGAGAMWMLNLAMVGATIVGQCYQVSRDKEFRDALLAQNAQALEHYVTEVLPAMAQAVQAGS